MTLDKACIGIVYCNTFSQSYWYWYWQYFLAWYVSAINN